MSLPYIKPCKVTFGEEKYYFSLVRFYETDVDDLNFLKHLMDVFLTFGLSGHKPRL